jgi:hypothetical protein
LKDERRTSNVEHRMKKQIPNTDAQRRRLRRVTFNGYFCFFSAVLILVTKILINSSVSFKISFSSSDFLINGTC